MSNFISSEDAPKLEICTGDPEGVMAAIEGGANRIELCSGLSEGGLTPSSGMISFSSGLIPTNVLIRPRGGDFIYTPRELDLMEKDIEIAVKAGASGIVIGVLTPDCNVDLEACERLLRNVKDLDNTFHRAFDLAKDPFQALEDVIDLGFKRILTSGQKPTALEGAELIGRLHKKANGRIKLMAGAGVTPDNTLALLISSQADDIHASAGSIRYSMMRAKGNVSMGSADSPDGSRKATDRVLVRGIRNAIDKFYNDDL